jgi:CRISPR-associated protein Csb2
MSNECLCISVTWLGDRFHGRSEDGENTEWPPSPFRLFQGLLDGASRHGEHDALDRALPWLEELSPPKIVAPSEWHGNNFNHYVPDNDNRFVHMKPGVRKFRPALFAARSAVHYIWSVQRQNIPINELNKIVETLGHLGWATDFAFANVSSLDQPITTTPGYCCWFPKTTLGNPLNSLRVPKSGSLKNLRHVYLRNAERRRNSGYRVGTLKPSVFDRVLYMSSEHPIGRPCVVFRLLDENEDTERYPHAKLMHIAGRVRHAAIKAMNAEEGFPPPWIKDTGKWVENAVAGHNPKDGSPHQQFSYIPVPSIGHDHSDAMIRNVMIVAPFGWDRELQHLTEQIDGKEMVPEHPSGESGKRMFLQRFTPPRDKFISRFYLGKSYVWQTVTPVVLDGHIKRWKEKLDDGTAVEVTDHREWIAKALQRAGLETPCEFEWQSVPFFKNTLSAYKRDEKRPGYFRPNHLEHQTAVHVRLRFSSPFTGPLAIGAGRHVGFGTFAAMDGSSHKE